MTGEPVREAVGVFQDEPSLRAAVGGAVAAAGAGGLIGGAVSRLRDRHHAECVDQRLARGGLRLWVHTGDRDRETRARRILKRETARDVHVHDVVHAGPDFVGGVSRDMSFMNKIGPKGPLKSQSL